MGRYGALQWFPFDLRVIKMAPQVDGGMTAFITMFRQPYFDHRHGDAGCFKVTREKFLKKFLSGLILCYH